MRRPYKKKVGPITLIHADASETVFWLCVFDIRTGGPHSTWARLLRGF